MAYNDVARDREAEASASGLAVAGRLEPLEGCKGALRLIGRNAGTVVPDVDGECRTLVCERYADFAPIFATVVNQVGEGTPERHGTAGQLSVVRPRIRDAAA